MQEREKVTNSILLYLVDFFSLIFLVSVHYNFLPVDAALDAKQLLKVEACISYLAIYLVVQLAVAAQGDDVVHFHPMNFRFCIPATSISCRGITKDLRCPSGPLVHPSRMWIGAWTSSSSTGFFAGLKRNSRDCTGLSSCS